MSFNPDRSRINNEIVRSRNEELQRAAERKDAQRAVNRAPSRIVRGLARVRAALRHA
jgi:hypothetical protein